MNILLKLKLIFISAAMICLSTPSLEAVIYKFVDENGSIHFVDDESKIPPKYLNETKKYKGKYDHLPEAEKRRRLAEEKRASSENKKRELKEWAQEKEEEEARQAREEFLKSLETRVSIQGNRVVVPTLLNYQGREISVRLLLDTGAERVVIHQQIADQLNITQSRNVAVRVADGKIIKAKFTKLSRVRVGPYIRENLGAFILNQKGPSHGFDGLLGMNFLRGLEYKIDFENQLIKWRP